MGLVARRLGQAQVIAEMVTGFLLGPSLLRLGGARRVGLAVPPRGDAERLRPGADRADALHVHGRPRVRGRSAPALASGRRPRCRWPASWRRSRSAAAWAILLHSSGGFFSESMTRQPGGAVPRRLAVDHRLPGAGAHPQRARPDRHGDRHDGARRGRDGRCRGLADLRDRRRQLQGRRLDRGRSPSSGRSATRPWSTGRSGRGCGGSPGRRTRAARSASRRSAPS